MYTRIKQLQDLTGFSRTQIEYRLKLLSIRYKIGKGYTSEDLFLIRAYKSQKNQNHYITLESKINLKD